MNVNSEELIEKLNRLVDLTYFICHNINDYKKNEKIIEKMIKKIEKGNLSELIKGEIEEDE